MQPEQPLLQAQQPTEELHNLWNITKEKTTPAPK
jgi:hypothetical protein